MRRSRRPRLTPKSCAQCSPPSVCRSVVPPTLPMRWRQIGPSDVHRSSNRCSCTGSDDPGRSGSACPGGPSQGRADRVGDGGRDGRADRSLTAISRPIGGVVVDGQRVDGYELPARGVRPLRHPPRLPPPRPRSAGHLALLPAGLCTATAPNPNAGGERSCPCTHCAPTRTGGWAATPTSHRWPAGSAASAAHLRGRCRPTRPSSRGRSSRARTDPSPASAGASSSSIPPRCPSSSCAPEASDLLESRELRDRIAGAHRAVLVDHAAVMRTLRQVLEPMAGRSTDPLPRRDQLEAFRAARRNGGLRAVPGDHGRR